MGSFQAPGNSGESWGTSCSLQTYRPWKPFSQSRLQTVIAGRGEFHEFQTVAAGLTAVGSRADVYGHNPNHFGSRSRGKHRGLQRARRRALEAFTVSGVRPIGGSLAHRSGPPNEENRTLALGLFHLS